jgi:hypothetical protein
MFPPRAEREGVADTRGLLLFGRIFPVRNFSIAANRASGITYP